jgi:tetratricopeptide (TPR) repeat protein
LLQSVIDTYDATRHTGYGRFNDAKVTACCWLSYCHLNAGRFDQARWLARMAIDHADALAQPFVLTQALSVAARPFAELGDTGMARELCRRCIDVCDTQRLPFWKGWAMIYEGVASAREGQYAAALARLDEALAHLASNGGRNDLGYVHAWRAQALARLGRCEEARAGLARARSEFALTGQQTGLVDLAHAEGVVDMVDPQVSHETAIRRLRAALDAARRQNLRLLELRASVDLACLLRAAGRSDEARTCLEPVMARFEEGQDCALLMEAQRVLGECVVGV